MVADRPGEQRRSRRFEVRLPVDISIGAVTERVESVDVSRHGLFVATEHPPDLRFLVRVAIHLEDGPVYANAFVARHAETEDGLRGAGLQFFAMGAGAKARWDGFVAQLSERYVRAAIAQQKARSARPARGSAPPAQMTGTSDVRWVGGGPAALSRGGSGPIATPAPVPSSAPIPAPRPVSEPPEPAPPDVHVGTDDIAHFLVKLPNLERLVAFFDRAARLQSVYMVTPLIRPVGSSVKVILIHPKSAEEFLLSGMITRVRTDPPKGIEIYLDPISDAQRQAFTMFLEPPVGRSRDSEPVPAGPAPGGLIDPDVEMPIPMRRRSSSTGRGKRPGSEPPIPSPRSIGRDPDTGDLPIEEAPTSISIDLTGFPSLDEGSVQQEHRFEWGSVSGDVIIDLDLSEIDPAPAESRPAILEDLDEEISDQELMEAASIPPPKKPEPAEETSYQAPPETLVTAASTPPSTPAPPPWAVAALEAALAREEQRPPAEEPLVPPQRGAEVRCPKCDRSDPIFGGHPPPPLGYFAAYRSYWCKKCKRYCSVLRLAGAEHRQSMQQRLGAGHDSQATLALAFEVADLSQAPRCPTCSAALRSGRGSENMDRILAALPSEGAEIKRVTCAGCGHAGIWVKPR